MGAYKALSSIPFVGPALGAAAAGGILAAGVSYSAKSLAGRALGGQVRGGESYVVGERGPEVLTMGAAVRSGESFIVGENGREVLTMGSSNGRIIPNSAISNLQALEPPTTAAATVIEAGDPFPAKPKSKTLDPTTRATSTAFQNKDYYSAKSLAGRALGGQVRDGESYVVGERGPEVLTMNNSVRSGESFLVGENGREVLTMGSSNGKIIPNSDLRKPKKEESGYSAFSLAGRVLGGQVRKGESYMVGERGPEILTMGSASGKIIPNSSITQAQATGTINNTANVTFSITANDTRGFDELLLKRRGMIASLVQSSLNNLGRSI
jgi:SLT domain-containing protein